MYTYQKMDIVHEIDVPGDGDCFFAAVHLAVREWRPELTVHALRAVVSRACMAPGEIGDAQREHLRNLFHLSAVPGMESETRYVRMAKTPHNTLDTRKLSRIMMNKSIYWGDEVAICTLERFLDVNILVLDDSHMLVRGKDVPRSRSIMIKLSQEHYKGVFVRSRSGKNVHLFERNASDSLVELLSSMELTR